MEGVVRALSPRVSFLCSPSNWMAGCWWGNNCVLFISAIQCVRTGSINHSFRRVIYWKLKRNDGFWNFQRAAWMLMSIIRSILITPWWRMPCTMSKAASRKFFHHVQFPTSEASENKSKSVSSSWHAPLTGAEYALSPSIVMMEFTLSGCKDFIRNQNKRKSNPSIKPNLINKYIYTHTSPSLHAVPWAASNANYFQSTLRLPTPNPPLLTRQRLHSSAYWMSQTTSLRKPWFTCAHKLQYTEEHKLKQAMLLIRSAACQLFTTLHTAYTRK